MKNIHTLLSEIGITVPEEKKADFDKAVLANYKTVAEVEKITTAYQTKIADMEFNSVLDGAISKSGARNATAVKALLDLDSLKTSKNQADDITKALESVKSENGYMFGSDEPFQNPVKDTGNPIPAGITKEMFAKMGYSERLNLKKSDPQKYEQLKG